jgi:hypothetical protein
VNGENSARPRGAIVARELDGGPEPSELPTITRSPGSIPRAASHAAAARASR